MSSDNEAAAGASRDLFVSYATSDAREIAENVVIDLERRGLKCWIAPRDIPAGTRSWAAEIVRSIRDNDNFLLLLSEAANASEEIEKELSEAARHRKTVFVIRLSDIEPSDGLGYHLNRVQWRDLFRNREDVLNEIAGRVIALQEAKLAADAARPVGPVAAALDFSRRTQPAAAAAAAAPLPKRPPMALLAAGVAGLAAVGLGAMLLLRPAAPPPETAAEQAQRVAIEKINLDKAKEELLARDRQKTRDEIVAALAPHVPTGFNPGNLVDRYMDVQGSKAIAVSPGISANFSAGLANESDAMTVALEACQVINHSPGGPCGIIAVNGRVLAAPGKPLELKEGPRVSYAGPFDPAKIASYNPQRSAQPELIAYRDAQGPKAAALYPFGRVFTAVGMSDQHAAEKKALADCGALARMQRVMVDCYLYAAGNEVVLASRATEPLALQMASAGSPPLAGSAPAAAVPMPGSAPAPARPMPAATPAAENSQIAAGSLRDRLLQELGRAAPQYRFAEIQADRFVADRQHRALVYKAPNQAWRWTGAPSPDEAVSGALEGCGLLLGTSCDVLFVDENVRSTADFAAVKAQTELRLAHAGKYDPDMIPTVYSGFRRQPDFANYGKLNGPKAIAINPFGRLFIRTDGASQFEAEKRALAACSENAQGMDQKPPCFLYASGNDVVLPRRLRLPMAQP
jgi:hypothetical protein